MKPYSVNKYTISGIPQDRGYGSDSEDELNERDKRPFEGSTGGFGESDHHQRIQVNFGSIQFSSDFDSGNLLKVERVFDSPGNQFNLWIAPDGYLTPKEMKYRTWFYFSVTGVPANNIVYFNIKNTNFQQKLFKEGHQPVFKSSHQNKWQRVASNVANTIIQHETGIDFTFTHVFNDPLETVYFAFTYPWSYTDNQEMLDLIDKQYIHDKEIYFHRTTIVQSKEARNVELLTISSTLNKTDKQLNLPSDLLFPFSNRPDLFSDKKYVFISTRVHPGEVPGSHVFNGMLSLLLNRDDLRAKTLRDNFVFVMVPLLNPDGVSRGHYRTDSQGQNLNRFYINPSEIDQPEIFGVKQLLVELHKQGLLYCYIDLHAHATKKGSFIYGNCMDFRNQVASNLLTKLMSLNTPYFEYEQCNFTERNMYSKDKSDGLSKEGSGRVALYKHSQIPFCYTLECNYNMANLTNTLYPRTSECTSEKTIPEFSEMNLNAVTTNVNFEQNPAQIPYSPSHYSNLGEGMLEALLDLNRINPISRIQNSPYGNITTLKMQVAFQIIKQIPYRFDPYLRKLLRHMNACDNSLPSLKLLYQYVEKGQKSSLINDTDNTAISKKDQAQGGQLLLQKQQLKRKTAVPLQSRVISDTTTTITTMTTTGLVNKPNVQELKIDVSSKPELFTISSKKPFTRTPLAKSANNIEDKRNNYSQKIQELFVNENNLSKPETFKYDLQLQRPQYNTTNNNTHITGGKKANSTNSSNRPVVQNKIYLQMNRVVELPKREINCSSPKNTTGGSKGKISEQKSTYPPVGKTIQQLSLPLTKPRQSILKKAFSSKLLS